VHGATVVVIICIAVSSSMRQSAELHFTKGQTQKVFGYELTFRGVERKSEPHRMSLIGRFDVARNGKVVAQLEPRMNQYQTMREPIGTPDVYTTMTGDFYIALSNIDPMAETTSVNVYATPLVVWIWIAVILMGIGALFGLIPARRAAHAPVVDDAQPIGDTA
jgi:cytochrome c-type biogenesis protein CcmF